MKRQSISELRRAKNITQIEMAQKLNIAVSTYNTYENGSRKVPQKIAREIAKVLGVDVLDIFLPATFTISKSDNEISAS